jgi:hypothetical protein
MRTFLRMSSCVPRSYSEEGAGCRWGKGWNSGGPTVSDCAFTITATPQPSTYLGAAGLLGLMLWPSRKRLVRDAKEILGFTPPMRDRLARRASEG